MSLHLEALGMRISNVTHDPHLSGEARRSILEILETERKNLIASEVLKITITDPNNRKLSIRVSNPLLVGPSTIPHDVIITIGNLSISTHLYPLFQHSGYVRDLVKENASRPLRFSLTHEQLNVVLFIKWLSVLEEGTDFSSFLHSNLHHVDEMFRTLKFLKSPDLEIGAQQLVDYFYSFSINHNSSGDWSFPPEFKPISAAIRRYDVDVVYPPRD